MKEDQAIKMYNVLKTISKGWVKLIEGEGE